jgi:uncharacterized Zn finger protein
MVTTMTDSITTDTTKLSAATLTPVKKGKSWCSIKFAEFFSSQFGETTINAGYEYTRKKRVLDLIIAPGRVVAKVQTELSGATRVEILFSQLSDELWNQFFSRCANNSLTLAYLLNNELPEEIENIFESVNAKLFPSTGNEIEVLDDGKKCSSIRDHVAAAIYKLLERLDENPLHILTLRGRGLEETILEIKRHRLLLSRPKQLENKSIEVKETRLTEISTNTQSNIDYWTLKPEVEKLSYYIKADELPSAILQYLEPLPLSGLEEDVHPLLEIAYAHIAKRAQVYGLGF